MNRSSITIDTTGWPLPDRVALHELADAVNARLAERTGSTPPIQNDLDDVDDVEPSGWNKDAYMAVITNLLRGHHVQVAAIFEAIKNGTGYVSREKVYELGNYSATRSLKGFTRPVNRFTEAAVDAGLLPDMEEVEELLRPDYDPAVKGFQRARGFFVPAEVVKLGLQWRAEAEAEAEAGRSK